MRQIHFVHYINTFVNIRLKCVLSIENKCILQFETNTFCNLRPIVVWSGSYTRLDGERYVKYKYEEWLISSFDESVSQSITMISARDAGASEQSLLVEVLPAPGHPQASILCWASHKSSLTHSAHLHYQSKSIIDYQLIKYNN